MNDAVDSGGYLRRITIATATRRYILGGAPKPPVAADEAPARRPSLASEARRWSYVLRSRERWPNSDELLKQQQHDAQVTLQHFGLDESALREIAVAGHVVVQMPYAAEHVGWEGRTFPWEFVLSRATRPFRLDGQQLTVMRQLDFERKRWPAAFAPRHFSGRRLAPRVLFLHSLPGALAQGYEGQQQDRVRGAFGLAADDARWRVLNRPTLDELRAACASFKPEFVHIAGCDTHQGLLLLRDEAGPETLVAMADRVQSVADWLDGSDVVYDGLFMRRDDGLPTMVLPQALGAALVAGGQAPFFVGLNVWNSAARLAPMLLPEGVLASMGFQDSFDDSLAEYFFENLYGRLGQLDWCLPDAFEAAWAEIRRQVDLMPGTGIALWARAPLLPAPGQRRRAPSLEGDWRRFARPAAAGKGRAAPAAPAPSPVRLIFKEKQEINYAELHNHQPLFDSFELFRLVPDAQPQVRIAVELHCGPERARYESEFTLLEPRLNMLRRIKVPLTSVLMRTASEAVRSALQVQVFVDGQVLLNDTFALRLLPVDQWRDNQVSGAWLPSFVLPRDGAIQRAVTAAQRYVRVIRDDPNAGFEGYQSAPSAGPPPSPDDEALDSIDLQVEAIWAALLHEWQLGYINPPPTYSDKLDSQRLRTPSAIHDARMGTCIDLALMFAACLELVDIYPVIFLLKGHALPGYWRHRDFQTEFRKALPPARDSVTDVTGDIASAPKSQRAPWWTADYDTVWPLIRSRQLAPLETVRLTEHCGFRDARQAGIDALRGAGDFDSLLDIIVAREHLITPLPIIGELT